MDELFDLEADPEEKHNLIDAPEHAALVAAMRQKLYNQLKTTGGLNIPLGFKRNHGSNRRNPSGHPRSEFPDAMISPAGQNHGR
ncbi:MAG: hypothetical protein KDA96_05790 [Planctomycetaceae bacterium]|nr:hypothetical protein [Planctomycetaceae bacterium]